MTQALKFESLDLHLDKFDFTINHKKNEIISCGDDLVVKIFDLNTKLTKECIDVNDEIKAISYGCGKLVYCQSNNLQMVDFNTMPTFSEDAAILLTKFNSTIRKIVFNEILNLIISFSEDDDLQIVNLTTLDVMKYKSNHEGSLKNMSVSPNGDFLITTGCDGYLSIYEFLKNDDLGKILAKKKISISQKLSLENVQVLDVDINSLNQCVIGGNLILRLMTLNNSYSMESLNVLHENSISHKDDINYVKWINNHLIATCDVKNLFKVWNFSSKSCIYQLDAGNITLSNHDNYISRVEIFKPNNDVYHIIFIDRKGNLNISDKINFSKQTENQTGNKFKDVKYKLKAIEEGEVDKKIENMISDLDFDEDSKNIDNILNNDEEKTNNAKTEDILNLSDVEDENGEIKNPDDIQKAREEKNKEDVVESFADDIIGCLPQQILNSTSTSLQNNLNARYLCWNMIGQIIQRQEANFKAIDIIFADISNKKKITYIDVNDLSLAVMNNCGAFLANQHNEEDEDVIKLGGNAKTCVLQFKSIQTNLNSVYKDWSINLPSIESSLCLAMGTDWCAVFTNLFYLRVFSLYGNQKMILSLPQIVSMTGYENYLAYVYHSSVPLFSCQNLRFKILDSNKLFHEVYDGILPLSPESTLSWFTFTEDGILVSSDSNKVIRGFFINVCHNWIPLLDLQSTYCITSNINYWPIGIQDQELYGVELKGFMKEPTVNAKLAIKVHPIEIPFITTSNLSTEAKNVSEEKILSGNLIIRHEQVRYENYKILKQTRDVKSPEFYYSDNLKDEQDLNNKKIDYDKIVLSHMKECTVNGTPERIIDLFNFLMRAKSREIAIKFCQQLDLHNIAQILMNKMELMKFQISEEKGKNFNYINKNIPRMSNGNHNEEIGGVDNIENNARIYTNNDNTNNIFSFAINVDNFRNVEEEVRNEMLRNEDKNYSQLEDNNLLNVRASINLEKKNSNPFFKSIDSNSKQNYNLYDDLSKSYSGLINQQNKNLQVESQPQVNKSASDLSFQNVKQKIGFKRKNNELITTNKSATNDTNITHADKKFKKI